MHRPAGRDESAQKGQNETAQAGWSNYVPPRSERSDIIPDAARQGLLRERR